MSDYGDDEPEDAWHPDDSIAEQVRNLARRMRLLDGGPEPRGTPVVVLDTIRERIIIVIKHRQKMNDRAIIRLIQLIEDAGFVSRRL